MPAMSLKAIVLTSCVIETSADSPAKGARDTLHHHSTPRCSKSFSGPQDEMAGAAGHETLLAASKHREAFSSVSEEKRSSRFPTINPRLSSWKTEDHGNFFFLMGGTQKLYASCFASPRCCNFQTDGPPSKKREIAVFSN